jgi:hypothetical protein
MLLEDFVSHFFIYQQNLPSCDIIRLLEIISAVVRFGCSLMIATIVAKRDWEIKNSNIFLLHELLRL